MLSRNRLLPIIAMIVFLMSYSASVLAAEPDGWYAALRLGYFPYTADVEGTIVGRDFDTEAKLSDLMDDTETLLGGEIEVGKGRLFLNVSGLFQEIETNRGTSTRGAKITSSETAINPMLGYRIYQQGLTAIDLMAGLYYVKVDVDAEIYSILLGNIDEDRSFNFTDPMVGIRGYYGFNSKFGVGAAGKVGGFGVGSESHYDLSASLVCHLNEMFALSGGYRIWSWEYEDKNAALSKFEQTLTGPFVGLEIKFQ